MREDYIRNCKSNPGYGEVVKECPGCGEIKQWFHFTRTYRGHILSYFCATCEDSNLADKLREGYTVKSLPKNHNPYNIYWVVYYGKKRKCDEKDKKARAHLVFLRKRDAIDWIESQFKVKDRGVYNINLVWYTLPHLTQGE
jgi:hypothetical protein